MSGVIKVKWKSIDERDRYPEAWTDYMTVRELREALANPLLMDGDLTNVRLIRRSVDGVFSLRVVTEFDPDE